MSQAAIRAALEIRLAALAPALETAYENVPFAPPASSVPFQKAFVLFATPNNIEQGTGYEEIGYMQVTLQYPLGSGSGDAAARAKLVRDSFPKNSSLVNSGVVTTIQKTPSIGNGTPDGDRWAISIKIPFKAQIYP